jgi:raffinose/stachyose/melibiose transport system substrate-binding protein
MRVNRIVIVIATLMLVLSVVVGGCGPTATPAPAEPTEAPPAEPTKAPEATATPEEEVTITFWHIYGPEMEGAHSWFTDMIAAFEEEYPNIHIEEEITASQPYTMKLKTAVAAGEAPDAFLVIPGGRMEPYAKEGTVLPVDKYLDEGGWRDNYIVSAFDEVSWDGKTYAFPLAVRTTHIWYNKEVFDKYGLEPPETMAELKEIVKTLLDDGVTPFAFGNKERWEGAFWTTYLFARIGGYETWKNAVEGKGMGWADPSHVEALALVQELVEMGAFTEGANGLGLSEVYDSFFTGEAAMILLPTFFLDQVPSMGPEGFLEEKLGYFNLPIIEGGKGSARDVMASPGSAFVINSKTEHPDEVVTFYRFIFTPGRMTELSKRTNWVMTVKDTIPDDASPWLVNMAKEAAQVEHAIWFPGHSMSPAIFEVYQDASQATFGLSITPEEAVAQIEEAVKQESGQ